MSILAKKINPPYDEIHGPFVAPDVKPRKAKRCFSVLILGFIIKVLLW